MRTKPTIAIYSGEIPSTTFVERLIVGLAEKNYKIHLFGIKTKSPIYKGSVLNHGYINHPFFKGFYLIKYWFLLTFFKNRDKRKLDSYLKDHDRWTAYNKVKTYPVLWYRPTIFHVQWAKGLEDWLWVQDFGMKLVLSLRGAHINYSPIASSELAEVYRSSFTRVDRFHAVSDNIGKEAQVYGADPTRIKTIYSGLDLDQLSFEPFREKQKTLHILSIGRAHWVKGYQYTLDACFLLKTQSIPFSYEIVGGFGDIELLYQVEDLDLRPEVQLLKNQSFSQVLESIKQADVLVLSSVKEGLANVVLEAMALGTVVVATDCGGMNEVIEHGVNGFLVPIRQPKVIAAMLKHVFQLPQEKLNQIKEKARKTIEKQHSLERMVEGMEELYLDVSRES